MYGILSNIISKINNWTIQISCEQQCEKIMRIINEVGKQLNVFGEENNIQLYQFVYQQNFKVIAGQYSIEQNLSIDFYFKMSRCEHGQVITIYCLNEACTWRQPGGCENCFKRYHTHPSNVGTISSEKLDELYRKMIVRPDPKAKSRIFQEALYNYLVIMKNQLTSSIDTISRAVTNRLSYPYLFREGQIQTFNKIKNKEFKKIQKKQLKNFINFASQIPKQSLEQKQKSSYLAQVDLLTKYIQKINEVFVLYQKSVKNIDNSFKVENAYIDKINQISSSIFTIIQENKPFSSSDRSQGGRSCQKGKDLLLTNFEVNFEQKQKKQKKQRDRKLSIDLSSENSLLKNKLNQKSNEAQNNERRKRMLETDNPKNSGMDEIKVNLINQTSIIKNSPKEQTSKQSNLSNNLNVEKGDKNFRDISADKSFFNREKDNNIIQDIASAIVHTILPRQASKPKLYQYSKDVKQKKFTVPMNTVEENAECSSPILKKKKTIAQQNRGLNLFRVQSKHHEEKESQFQQSSQTKTEAEPVKNKQQDKLMLKENQAESLALLMASLSMSAQQAIPLLEAAIKYAKNNLSAAQYLSYLYLQIGKPKQCLNVCNKFLQKIQDSAQYKQLDEHLTNNKAAALNMLGRYSQSISILEKCIQNNEKDINYKNLADAYFSISIYEKAMHNYEKAVKMNPNLDEAYYNLAVCLYMQGNFIEAQLNIQKALKINHKNDSYLQLHKQISNKVNLII